MHINQTTIRVFVAALAVSLLGACNILGTGSQRATVNPGPTETGQQPRAYPSALEPVAVHDIQVFRESTRLRLTNTTATAFGQSTLWINRRYAHDISSFGIGQTLDLNLGEFVDQFATSFRAGGFFATKRPDRVVLVELETTGQAAHEIHGLIIVRDEVD